MAKKLRTKILDWKIKRAKKKGEKLLKKLRDRKKPDSTRPESGTSNFKLQLPKIKKVRRLAKTLRAFSNKSDFKKNEPMLARKKFERLLASNITKNVNTGNFKKAKELIPIYKKVLKGQLSNLQQFRLEQKGVVGTYTVEKGKKGFTLSKVYNKLKLAKIMPNDTLSSQQFKILNQYLGYSTRTIKQLKKRQFIASITPVDQPQKDIERAERDFRMNGLSWSGSPDFDRVIQYMGGFAIAISKYEKVVQEVAERYDVPLDDLIKEYLPNYAD